MFALNLLDRWLDSLSLSKGLDDAILEADRIAGLGNDMTRATIKHGPFLSHAAERAIFANTCTSLSQQSGRELLEALASLNDDLHRHAQGFWNYKDSHSHQQSIPWGELARLGTAVQMLLDASPLRDWANPGEAIAWYTKNGWRVDKAGEELLRNLDKPTPELLTDHYATSPGISGALGRLHDQVVRDLDCLRLSCPRSSQRWNMGSRTAQRVKTGYGHSRRRCAAL